ncbi:hypothetical protein Daus18300_009229 [Diaporthe australafricana]|uniref:Uncharacterized protein n=1 Tax=Diaporthe australafricana TaxID=127596 RepID=A0ABR3WF07_9PEZI
MVSWLRKSYSMPKTNSLARESGKDKTKNPDASNSPDGGRPLVKASTDYAMYNHAVDRPGQPERVPVCIHAYNLDWDELLRVLRVAYPNHEFPDNLGVEDHYKIYVPRQLTDEEKGKIERLRKSHRDRVDQAAGKKVKRGGNGLKDEAEGGAS